MYYIQEIDKPDVILNAFNIVKMQEDKIILPVNSKTISEKKAYRLAYKVIKLLKKGNSKKIVLSNKVKNYKEFVNILYTNGFDIIDGKWLFGVLSKKIIDYVIAKKEIKKEEVQVTILVNELNEILLENIKKIVQEYKKVNIVTNHNEKFKNIEKKLLEEEGIMITVGNNKRKSLSKSQIILNVDFPTELINKYNINENAIIINLMKNVKICLKRFNGININDYEITLKKIYDFDFEKQQKYKLTELYEAQIYKKQPYENIIKRIEKDQIEIEYLKGENNKI